MAAKQSAAVDTSAITRNILVIRGHRVLLDSDLASLYQVETKALTRAGSPQCQAFSRGFHVPTRGRRVWFSKEPIWRL
jgi:ORF6N domain-containing protein